MLRVDIVLPFLDGSRCCNDIDAQTLLQQLDFVAVLLDVNAEEMLQKVPGIVMLIPKEDPWRPLINSLEHFSGDCLEEREQLPSQKREDL